MGDLYINDPLHIVDDEFPWIGEIRVMFNSQPGFKMGKGTEPIKDLNDECKEEGGEMYDPYNLVSPPP